MRPPWGRSLKNGYLFWFRRSKTGRICLALLFLVTVICVLATFPSLKLKRPTPDTTAIDNAEEETEPFYIENESTVNVPKEELSEVRTTKEHLILIYTTMWGRKPWSFFDRIEKYEDRHGNKCPVQNCEITYDKSLFKEASAVVFHCYGVDAVTQSELKLLSRERRKDQIWIYFTHTTPNHARPHASFFNGFFNWTMTYQRNSDIVVPYSWELGTWQRRTELDEPHIIADHAKGKDSLVYAEINRCGLLRDRFIKKLQEYVSIDVYGACSKRFHKDGKVLPKQSQIQLKLKKRYKFYLAAERDYCNDFVSQRFFKAIFDGYSVPIVLGGANYSSAGIPKSYIDAMSFKTVRELGDYIKYLDSNSDAYNKYQHWRKDYILGPSLSWTCEVCKKLNKDHPRKVYSNLGDWFNEKNCEGGFDSLKKLLNDSKVRV